MLEASLSLGRRRISGGELITQQSEQGFSVEARIPRGPLESLIGPDWAFAALYHDIDRSGGDSIYATHFVNSQQLPLQQSIAFGIQAGARLAFEQSARRPLRPLRSVSGKLSARGSEVTFHVTDREVVAFGRLPRQSRFQYVYHNWSANPEISSMKLQALGDGPLKSLVIEHEESPNPSVRLKIFEIYSFAEGRLQRRFAHELEQRVSGEGRASATIRVRGRPAEIELTETRINGLDRGNAYDILPSPGLRPLMFPWRPGIGARSFALDREGWIPKEN